LKILIFVSFVFQKKRIYHKGTKVLAINSLFLLCFWKKGFTKRHKSAGNKFFVFFCVSEKKYLPQGTKYWQ